MEEKLGIVTSNSGRPYSGFNGQYISGSWRPGKQGEIQKDTDPYSGEVLAEIVLGNESDLDEAYRSTAKVQVAWLRAFLPCVLPSCFARLPSCRSDGRKSWTGLSANQAVLVSKRNWSGGLFVPSSWRRLLSPIESRAESFLLTKRARRAGHTANPWE